MSDPISTNTGESLDKLTETYRDAKTMFEAHRDRWHEGITEAVDEGMRPAEVARIVGVSPQRILAIVARVYSHG